MGHLPFTFLLLGFIIRSGFSFCIHNNIGHPITAEISALKYKKQINPGDKNCCNECGGSRDKVYDLSIFIQQSTVSHRISTQAGGCIYVEEVKQDWNWPKDSAIAKVIQTTSRKIDPNTPDACTSEVYSSDPYINTDGSARSVNFLATADTQYWVDQDNTKAVPDRTIATMIKKFHESSSNRGITVAGDLVQRADWWQANYKAYLKAFDPVKRYVFDGIGNHDIDEDGWTSISKLLSEVRERPRVTVTSRRPKKSKKTQPDYSWNWDDVHLVQLNEFPGSASEGLDWLKDDLKIHVGNSGNPVILIHHYGFDGFSRGWWTDDARKNYWEVIKDYNVVAFLTGHLHNPNPPDVKAYWEGDTYLGGKKIPYFISGAAQQGGAGGRGLFLEIAMNDTKMTVIRRFGDDGSEAGRDFVDLPPKKASG